MTDPRVAVFFVNESAVYHSRRDCKALTRAYYVSRGFLNPNGTVSHEFRDIGGGLGLRPCSRCHEAKP